MTTNDPDSIEWFESLEPVLRRTDVCRDESGLSRVAAVLENIETGERLRDRPVAVLCPNCGEQVEFYESGLPEYLCHFEGTCETCDIDSLPRWGVVAVDARYADVLPTSSLTRGTQRYWAQHLWQGIETSEDCPRTLEFSNLYDEFAERWGWDWRVHCPLCRRTREEIGTRKFDYHHWRRNPDTGILFCRACHDGIGGGRADMNLDWRARELGLRGKHDLQIARLAIREALVCEYGSLDQLAPRLVSRYNLVQSTDEVRCLLNQTVADPTIRNKIVDEYLVDGLDYETSG